MYCSIQNMVDLLPPSVKIGDGSIGVPSPGNPNAKRESISPDQAMKFIRMATQDIDARLTSFYIVPLRFTKTYETELMNDLIPGSNIIVKIWDTTAFNKGDIVRLQGTDSMETATITDVIDTTTIKLQSVIGTYYPETGKISVIKVPDPIPLITARLAVSYAFDELFTADQSPNISSYGKEMRSLAGFSTDSILEGTVRLDGQEHTGRRFIRGTLIDAYGSPTASQSQFQFGREKSS